jgi:hypothetical protein
MNTQQLNAYLTQWLENCLKDTDLFEHERAILNVMIRSLPEVPDGVFIDNPDEIDKRGYSIPSDGQEFITTSKGKMLKGKKYDEFMQFWKAFDYKKGRAEAAQAWLDIKGSVDIDLIVYAAKRTASECKEGTIRKMAQGWLTGRRWEEYEESFQRRDQVQDQWNLLRNTKMPMFYWQNNWPNHYGPNPWNNENTLIPEDIRDKFQKEWRWK